DLEIDSLVKRVKTQHVREVIMALSPTMEGDTTIFYISRKLTPFPVKITAISRGISVGGELEYTDELTLARALVNRMPYESFLVKGG
ncbi:MAG TPA: toprim domain-containing protein, partial [Chitinophagales bacterium]|nr:toprim domain-containing protein [Chitinophagales bacterium]